MKSDARKAAKAAQDELAKVNSELASTLKQIKADVAEIKAVVVPKTDPKK